MFVGIYRTFITPASPFRLDSTHVPSFFLATVTLRQLLLSLIFYSVKPSIIIIVVDVVAVVVIIIIILIKYYYIIYAKYTRDSTSFVTRKQNRQPAQRTKSRRPATDATEAAVEVMIPTSVPSAVNTAATAVAAVVVGRRDAIVGLAAGGGEVEVAIER